MRNRLISFGNRFGIFLWLGFIQFFQKIMSFRSHTGMDVDFRTFDMIMKVVTKLVNQVDSVVLRLIICMPWEKNKGDVPNIFSYQSSLFLNIFRRIVCEDHLRSICSLPTSFLVRLKKNFSKNYVVLVFENGGKDNRDPFRASKYIVSSSL